MELLRPRSEIDIRSEMLIMVFCEKNGLSFFRKLILEFELPMSRQKLLVIKKRLL